MVWPYLSSILLVGGCNCSADRKPPPPVAAIEVRGAAGDVLARVVPGRPCRARVEGVELLVGGRPLVAQHGAARWSGEDAPNGTTLSKDGVAVARVHARQLFDAEGLPILRVMEDGGIADRASAIVRRATVRPAGSPGGDAVVIAEPPRAGSSAPAGPAAPDGQAAGETTVTGTADVVLAAMLAAPEIQPELRAIVACHFLLPAER